MGKKFGVIIDDNLASSIVEIAQLNKVSPSKVVGLIVENQLTYFKKIGRYPIFRNSVVFEFPDPKVDDEDLKHLIDIAKTPWVGDEDEED